MTNTRRDLLLDCLRRPERMTALSLPEWETLIRQGRSALLLGRLHALLERQKLLDRVPRIALRHLTSERRLADAEHDAVRREVGDIAAALKGRPRPPVLLKGAAYVMAGLPNAAGRRFGDIDILVPFDCLNRVESDMMLHGWVQEALPPYDERYYRQWMHELPPMSHMHRGTVVDIHHGILPRTARLKPNSAKLLAAARPCRDDIRVLAPVDMVLHSACHLFHDGELEHGLRDLVDMDDLLRHFGLEAGFWRALLPRAVELDLSRPLYHALRYLRLLLGTPIPTEVRLALENLPGARPPFPLAPLMDALFTRALRPDHASAADRWTSAARFALYVRAHWLRMPALRLALHLAHKALRRKLEPMDNT